MNSTAPPRPSLFGFAIDGAPLATMRVQDGRLGPLELGRFIDVEAVLAPFEEPRTTGLATARQDGRVPRPLVPRRSGLCAIERPAVQFGRLSVLQSRDSIYVMFAMFKTAWKWSFDNALETIIIASPSWSQSIYEFMSFGSAGEKGQFQHEFAGGTRHVTMKLPIQTLEPKWRSLGQLLSDAFFGDKHPLLQP